MQTLKPNKACGHDQIINEFLKASAGKMIAIYTTLFNLILCSGKTPEEWSVGMVKPILKPKGGSDDQNRGIPILIRFGKLFICVINNRLVEYFDDNSTIGSKQAGLRAGHWIVDFFLAKKKRLYGPFVDYEKAYDLGVIWHGQGSSDPGCFLRIRHG